MATPYTTSCGIALTSIDGTDCIGDSRKIINGNITALGNTICSISGFNVVDSNTIDLSWNSSIKTLSADVKPDSVRYSQLASWQTLSASPTLSAEAVQPRLAKAWVNFDGSTVPPTIRESFNVSSIVKTREGNWTLIFTTPMPNTNYVLIGQSRPENNKNNPSIFGLFVTNNTSAVFTHANPTVSAAQIVSGQSAGGDSWDSDYVMAIVYSLK